MNNSKATHIPGPYTYNRNNMTIPTGVSAPGKSSRKFGVKRALDILNVPSGIGICFLPCAPCARNYQEYYIAVYCGVGHAHKTRTREACRRDHLVNKRVSLIIQDPDGGTWDVEVVLYSSRLMMEFATWLSLLGLWWSYGWKKLYKPFGFSCFPFSFFHSVISHQSSVISRTVSWVSVFISSSFQSTSAPCNRESIISQPDLN